MQATSSTSEAHAKGSATHQLVVLTSAPKEPGKANKRVQLRVTVPEKHFIFVRKVIYEEKDVWKLLPQKVGKISRRPISRQEWDRCCERQLELSPGDIVIARQSDELIEVFEQDDYDIIFPKINTMFKITMYNFADPPSIYPTSSRSQRLISQKLADDLYEAIRGHYGKVNIDHAYICGDPINPILRIVNVGKTEENPTLPDTVTGKEALTCEGYMYPVLGIIDENEVAFDGLIPDEELSRYCADGMLNWCWWSGDLKPKSKSRKRQPKNKKRGTGKTDEGSSAQVSDGSRRNEKTEGGDTPTEPNHVAASSSQAEDNGKTEKANKTDIGQGSAETINEDKPNQAIKPAHAINQNKTSQEIMSSDTVTKPNHLAEVNSESGETRKNGDTPTQSDHVTDTPSPTADSDKAYIDVAVEQIRADLKKLKGVGKKTDRANEPKIGL